MWCSDGCLSITNRSRPPPYSTMPMAHSRPSTALYTEDQQTTTLMGNTEEYGHCFNSEAYQNSVKYQRLSFCKK